VAKEQQNTAPDAQPGKPAATAKTKRRRFKKKKERRTVPMPGAHFGFLQQHADHHHRSDGRVICNSSAGSIGSRVRARAPYAAQQASLTAASAARDQFGMKSVEVKMKGPVPAVNPRCAPGCAGLHIVAIRDITPIPHNGCRPPNAAASDAKICSSGLRGLRFFKSSLEKFWKGDRSWQDTEMQSAACAVGRAEAVFEGAALLHGQCAIEKRNFVPDSMGSHGERKLRATACSCARNKKPSAVRPP